MQTAYAFYYFKAADFDIFLEPFDTLLQMIEKTAHPFISLLIHHQILVHGQDFRSLGLDVMEFIVKQQQKSTCLNNFKQEYVCWMSCCMLMHAVTMLPNHYRYSFIRHFPKAIYQLEHLRESSIKHTDIIDSYILLLNTYFPTEVKYYFSLYQYFPINIRILILLMY